MRDPEWRLITCSRCARTRPGVVQGQRWGVLLLDDRRSGWVTRMDSGSGRGNSGPSSYRLPALWWWW